jgi:hypothetical protein
MPFCGLGKQSLFEDATTHRTLKAAFASLGNMPQPKVREPTGKQSFYHPATSYTIRFFMPFCGLGK